MTYPFDPVAGTFDEVDRSLNLRVTAKHPFTYVQIARNRRRLGLPWRGYVHKARELNREWLRSRREEA